jgi:hypothetical protein
LPVFRVFIVHTIAIFADVVEIVIMFPERGNGDGWRGLG